MAQTGAKFHFFHCLQCVLFESKHEHCKKYGDKPSTLSNGQHAGQKLARSKLARSWPEVTKIAHPNVE
jgi:hypothetical protein